MKLQRLILHGFKSFADRTELWFHDGITAIVGPNGCGKSNLSDAIRWVLGEQRPSAIRGARMEEAIFQGTAGRRPVNRAEVSLVFSNEHGKLPVPFEEIEIRRTVFREGGSEYQLNRTSCRLRDILDLFRDTGLGANAYAVIEQGMVDSVLSDRADERRLMFEEAAGIGRYKERRRAAERRLESSESDLARLEDLVLEIESKVRTLARQKRRAQRHQELTERRLSLEVHLTREGMAEARETLAALELELRQLAEGETAARGKLATAELEAERQRLLADQVSRSRAPLVARSEEVGQRLAERERLLAVADERRGHGRLRLTQLARERDEVERRLAETRAEASRWRGEEAARRVELERLARRLTDAEEQQRELKARLESAQRDELNARARKDAAGRRVSELAASASSIQGRRAEAGARLERLADEAAGLEQTLSQAVASSAAAGRQAEDLTAGTDAARQALDELRASARALKEEEEVARQALRAAEQEESAALARLAAMEALEKEFEGFLPAVAVALAARESLPGLLGTPAELLPLDTRRAAAVETTLGSLLQVLVVRDPSSADRLARWLIEGDAVGSSAAALLLHEDLPLLEQLLGRFSFVGAPSQEPVVWGRKDRLAELSRKAAAVEQERGAAARAHAQVWAALTAAEDRLRAAEGGLRGLQQELDAALVEEREARSAAERGRRALSKVAEERDRVVADLAEAEEAHGAAAAQRHIVEEELTRAEAEVERSLEHSTACGGEWEAARERLGELRVALARMEGELALIERRHAQAVELERGALLRLETLALEEREQTTALADLEHLASGGAAELEELFTARDQASARLAEIDERLDLALAAARALEAEVRELRRRAEELGERRHRLELARAEAESRVQRGRERLEAEWGRPYEALLAAATPLHAPLDAVEAELNGVVAELERLGPINMLALQEHEEEATRLHFLESQRDDLRRAREDLQSAIRQMNRTAREQFLTTFDEVRENFRRTFHTLFEGGECDLWLADPDDPLECEIEISASPAGKRTQRIHLLSGGERALTALALLFAIYLVKPSPFCVLDEVDAPLDEANIQRFLHMLDEFKMQTQFILVTHNPRTMEAADWIYGVTMEEPGVSSIVGVRIDDSAAEVRAAG